MQKIDENLSSSVIGEEDDELSISDIEIDIFNDNDFDEDMCDFADLNFRDEEWSITKCPFPHWTVNR